MQVVPLSAPWEVELAVCKLALVAWAVASAQQVTPALVHRE